MSRISVSVVIAIILLFPACAPHVLRPGEQRVVETSGRKRSWVTSEQPTFREDDTWFFRGQALGVADLTLGLRQAEADAKKRIVGKVAEQVAAEYSEYALAANMSEGDKSVFVTDGITWASEAISVTGAAPAKSYWEKVESGRSYGVSTAYDVYVLVSFSTADYEDTRERAVRAIEERARMAANRRAEEATRRLRQRLERGQRQ